jgi:hypothetical protein
VGAAAGACAINFVLQAKKIAAGSIKPALSVALRNTENPFDIVLPLSKLMQLSVVASG